MVGNLELFVVILFVVYLLWMSLLYTITAYIFLFRKRDARSRFWKNFKIYLGIIFLGAVFKAVFTGVLSSFWFTLMLIPYLDTILMFFSAILIGLLASRWIRYDEETPIGLIDSFKVVGMVLVLSLIFNILMHSFTAQEENLLQSSINQKSSTQTSSNNYERVMNLKLSREQYLSQKNLLSDLFKGMNSAKIGNLGRDLLN